MVTPPRLRRWRDHGRHSDHYSFAARCEVRRYSLAVNRNASPKGIVAGCYQSAARLATVVGRNAMCLGCDLHHNILNSSYRYGGITKVGIRPLAASSALAGAIVCNSTCDQTGVLRQVGIGLFLGTNGYFQGKDPVGSGANLHGRISRTERLFRPAGVPTQTTAAAIARPPTLRLRVRVCVRRTARWPLRPPRASCRTRLPHQAATT